MRFKIAEKDCEGILFGLLKKIHNNVYIAEREFNAISSMKGKRYKDSCNDFDNIESNDNSNNINITKNSIYISLINNILNNEICSDKEKLIFIGYFISIGILYKVKDKIECDKEIDNKLIKDIIEEWYCDKVKDFYDLVNDNEIYDIDFSLLYVNSKNKKEALNKKFRKLYENLFLPKEVDICEYLKIDNITNHLSYINSIIELNLTSQQYNDSLECE